MTRSPKISWMLVAAALALPAAASAQMPGGGASPRPGSSPGTSPGNRGGVSLYDRPREERPQAGNIVELVNMRLGQLEEDLNLRPNQIALWKVYRDRVMQMLDDQRRAMRSASAYTAVETTAPKRLDTLADAARDRLTATEDIVDAGKAFYAVLTPEQRTIADRRLALPLATLVGSDTGAEPPRPTPAKGSEPPPAATAKP
ncbi:MAG: Spy/CpxP family protein refolding chaperone [Casimicrobiaceae bacterium]